MRAAMKLDRADGLVAMCHAVLRGDARQQAPVELALTIRREALAATGNAGAEPAVGCFEDGTVVTAETARRFACDCGVVELHEDHDGRPLSVGRRSRTISTAVARALAHRDSTCRFPGCTNRRFLDGHHLTHWIDGGETAIDNLCRLCPRHHRFVHEHGYRVEWQDDELAFFDGQRRVHGEPPRTFSAWRSWAAIQAANEQLEVDADTGRCAWDGEPVQYEWVVDRLVHLERRDPTSVSRD